MLSWGYCKCEIGVWNNDTSACEECSVGTYYNIVKNKCTNCKNGCTECSSRQVCSACEEGWSQFDTKCKCLSEIVNSDGTCEPFTCEDGYYNNGLFCEECNLGCTTCDDTGACPDACPDGSYMSNEGICVTCPSG